VGVIRRIEIQRYRLLENFQWLPAAGVNVLLGPGDSGKSTVLSALGLFEQPVQLNEFDYYKRRTAEGFEVTLVVTGLSPAELAAERTQLPIRGWKDEQLWPLAEGDAESALVFRASGTADLDLEFSLVAESGEAFALSSRLRRQLQLLTLTQADDASREFRGTKTSLLSRNFAASANFRHAARQALQHAVNNWTDPDEARKDLEEISNVFKSYGLPHELLLGIYPPSGAAASQSVAAFSGRDPKESIPFERSGEGTRQLSTLVLASRIVDKPPTLLADELEGGLEPHRQRIAAKLAKHAVREGQAFIVTHAPAVVSTLAGEHHWRIMPNTALQIPPSISATVFKVQPEAAFAKLTMVCEGDTELGLVPLLWTHYIGREVEECGVALVDAEGHTKALPMLENMIAAGLPCAGFVDNEAERSGTRDRIAEVVPLFTWRPLKMPEEALAKYIPRDRLEQFLQTIADARKKYWSKYEVHLIVANIRNEMKCEDKIGFNELLASYGESPVREALCNVLKKGVIKNVRVARAIGEWLLKVGIPAEIDALLKPFFEKCKRLM
jgi:putative ATP-dependent endonuclease of the OLD family